MEWWSRRSPNTPAIQHSSTPLHSHSYTAFLVRFHISGESEKGGTELINITTILTLIVQQDVFGHARCVVAMVVEVRALVGPVSIIEHESVHRDHDAELRRAVRFWSPRIGR